MKKTMLLLMLCAGLCGCASFPKVIGHAENYAAGKVPVGGDLLRALAKSHLSEKVPDGLKLYRPLIYKDKVIDPALLTYGAWELVPDSTVTVPPLMLPKPESDGEAVQVISYLEQLFPGAAVSLKEAERIKELLGPDPLGEVSP